MLPHMDSESMKRNIIFLMLAANDTSTSVLTGTLYFILNDKNVLSSVQNEIRGKFQSLNDITMEACEDLTYLKACITEAMRVYPPISGSLPRLVPENGATICGRFVPGNATVGIFHWAMNRAERNFKDPDQFKPERWLKDVSQSESAAHNPFSFGPRTCVARK